MSDNVIYTDGHGVKVTPYQLHVGSHEYKVDGISHVQLHTIKPRRAAALFIILIGLALLIAGIMHAFPETTDSVGMLTSNLVAILAGSVLLLFGIVWAAALHNKYAVRINTAEGEKNIVVSPKRDYIDQIVTAIHQAVTLRIR